MSARNGYEPGVPCWVDLGSPDPEASVRFYGELLGWGATEPGPPETGGYRMFTKGDNLVAGLGPLMSEGQPPAWTTYIWSEDADATAAAVSEAGGQVLVPPMDVMDAGRFAMFLDPSGAAFGIWQPGTNRGAQLVNEPGALTWNELTCRDRDAAKEFYARVFGWEFEDMEMGEMQYTTWSLNGGPVAGMLDMPPHVPAEVPSYWQTYFGVEDCDAALAKIGQLGGSTVMAGTDIPVGRFGIATDPNGAMVAVIAMAEWTG